MDQMIKKAWNERVSETTAHIKIDKWLGDLNKFLANYEQKILSKIEWKDKTVIDYGIGGGHVGKYLFDKKGITEYVGYDVAERSINAARNTLKGKNAALKLIDAVPASFGTADIFLCLAVIQHFPTLEYTKSFFTALNKSKIKILALSYRDGKELTFQSAVYKTTHEVSLANTMPLDFVIDVLSNYELFDQSCPDAVNQNYIVLKLKTKKKVKKDE